MPHIFEIKDHYSDIEVSVISKKTRIKYNDFEQVAFATTQS